MWTAGGPFNFVSCPHYLGEIVIYTGLALLTGPELPLTVLILCWVVSLLQFALQQVVVLRQCAFAESDKLTI